MKQWEKQRSDFERLYRKPANRRLKHIALWVIGAVIALQMLMIIFVKDIAPGVMLFMRGCVGLGAIIFVVICAILLYRVNSEYIHGGDATEHQD